MTNKWQRWKNIMKAYPFSEKRLNTWSRPYVVQPKYNGIRCRAIPMEQPDGSISFILLSSEENVIFSVPHINDQLEKLKVNYELDGELYCHGMSFEKISSITSRTVNIHPEHEKISLHIFDIVNSEQQIYRLKTLIDLEEEIKSLGLKNLIISPYYMCENLQDVMKVYEDLIDKNYEGIIVRNIYARYERKRSIYIMKFKPKKSDEYEIISFNQEMSINGVPKPSIGSLVCASGDGTTFSVGTGFTREEREFLWNIRNELKGRICKVSYQHLSAKKVPMFPVFVEVL